MIEFLVKEYAVERDASFLIGDRWKDIVPGNASGLTTILVGTTDKYKYLSEMPANAAPNCFAKDIREACQLIINDGE
jgi:FMN phosphatase YigB (HAD superfamily)